MSGGYSILKSLRKRKLMWDFGMRPRHRAFVHLVQFCSKKSLRQHARHGDRMISTCAGEGRVWPHVIKVLIPAGPL
eukprot:5716538-Pyramimonas_sp.AAC.1